MTVRVHLVTGISGCGKSTVARRLRASGHHAVSTDADAALCGWTDRSGRPVLLPDEPTTAWLAEHDWNWDPARLDAIIGQTSAQAATDGATVIWLCGNAGNQDQLLDRFDAVFLLAIDEATMLCRLDDPTRGNDYGRHGDARAVLLATLPGLHEHWRSLGAVVIDATASLDTVVAALLAAGANP
jgi:gluconate kinase